VDAAAGLQRHGFSAGECGEEMKDDVAVLEMVLCSFHVGSFRTVTALSENGFL
jgi:hypothetical protein